MIENISPRYDAGAAGHEDLLRLRAIAGALGNYAYRFGNELQLHDRLAEVLAEHGYSFEREYVLDAKNRCDFWIAGGLAIEVKVDGGFSQAMRQAIGRYIALPQVRGVLIASTERWARKVSMVDRPRWAGKPAHVVHLRRQAL
jgi:hypothetical protein